jgi:hypothetical protein
MSQPLDSPEAVFERLTPKIMANHASKLSGMEGFSYGEVLAMVDNPEIPLVDRLVVVAGHIGDLSLVDGLVVEMDTLRLCATGRETKVEDPVRQAAYVRSDENQTRDARSDRNLAFYLHNGVEVQFGAEAREAARRFCAEDERDVPLIEKLKAQRLLTVNGFDGSRVMYTVHDMIDHAWLFDQMRETGIMDRYADFLGSIEMEEDAFLYSRQAELLASVGFGARRWSVVGGDEQLVFQPKDLKSILAARDDERTAAVAQLIDSMNPNEQQQAVFMIENMAIQLTDERRRWGAVKQVSDGGERHPMSLLDPLHVALMVEALSMLQKSKAYGNVQLEATLRVEGMLRDAITDTDAADTLHVPIPRGNPPISESRLVLATKHHVEWLRNNPGVSTSYNKIG